MDRMAAGHMIAFGALVTNGSLVRDTHTVGSSRPQLSHGQVDRPLKVPNPVASGLRSERVLSLLIALEALRAAPAALDSAKD